MRRKAIQRAVAAGILAASLLAAQAQSPEAPAAQTIPAPPADQKPPASPEAHGGRLHGVVKSGSTPLPGVTVTAQNSLTGKRFSTLTDLSGTWSLTLEQNGRYVVRTQFAGFAQGAQEAVLNASSHDQTLNLDLLLASRAAELQRQSESAGQQALTAIQQLAGNGAQSLNLLSALAPDTETQAGSANAAGAALPGVAGNPDFGGDSVAISGQSGTVSPLAGLDMDRIRDAVETIRTQIGGQFGGVGGGNMGGFGGLFDGGGFGGGRGNFRGFNPGQPHGAIYWNGSNSALNAQPFSLSGQQLEQPPSGTNRFGLTLMTPPYIPGLTKPSGKDAVFLTLSSQHSSSPVDEYAVVPTDAERGGDFSAPGLPAIYDPETGLQFEDPVTGKLNVIPAARFASSPALALLTCKNASTSCQPYFPEPNLRAASNGYNYRLLTTAQSNSTQAGLRYMRSLGKNASLTGLGGRGGGGGRRTQQSQGLRQSINANYNWSHTAQDDVNIFPQLGGKGATDANSLQAGYTVGYRKLTSIFNVNWNRSSSHAINFFTNTSNDVAANAGISLPNPAPVNYGLPNVVLSGYNGLSEQQPSFTVAQTISFSEALSWIHGKHNLRFGGDYRRVHRDFLGGSDSTGTFTFTGKFTENTNGDLSTGSSLADFLLGTPQATTIDVAAGRSYLRENVMDLYATDDWRIRPNLTLTYGLRYEYFAPYTEKYNRLGMVDTNPASGFIASPVELAPGGSSSSGRLPDSLVFPFRTGFAPRLGVAWRLPRQAVLRGGFGTNYTTGEYSTFATTLARQPIVSQPAFITEQSNEASSACIPLTLANGFCPATATAQPGSYELDPHYQLPYVLAWNLDLQKTLRWGVMLNAGYNGSRGNRLDITSAPRPSPSSLLFNYEQAGAFSRFNAGTLRVNKRLSSGIALSANYQYAHSIDNAGSVGGTSTVVAQNWQDLRAEEGNSSFDVRHRVTGTYLYELPFGKDKLWITSGPGSHILEGFSISGSFTFATGTPLTPRYQAAVADVTRGTAGTLRPDRDFSQSLTSGGGSQQRWFNTSAFQLPAGNYGTASRNSIPGPGTVQNNMSLAKTMQLGETRSMELRASANNVFNTVQYSGVDTTVDSPTFGKVISAASMRVFNFSARFRF